jgi:hypothetical protein
VAGLAGEGVEKDEGLTMARFVAGDGAVRLSAATCGGGRRYPPLELLLRRDGRRGWHTGGTGKFGEPWGRRLGGSSAPQPREAKTWRRRSTGRTGCSVACAGTTGARPL